MSLDLAALDRTLEAAQRQLLAARLPANNPDQLMAGLPQGFWRGELASSALATATAVLALTLAGRSEDAPLADAGRKWLLDHANPDGGWGDTPESLSNISTTLLAWSALGSPTADAGLGGSQRLPSQPGSDDVIARAEQWIAAQAGSLEPSALAVAVTARYGRDRTFAVPILMACALAGRLGPARQAWRYVHPLPFELAALPHGWWPRLGLPVVSYALPALIAIGQARFHHRPPRCPLRRLLRSLARQTTLRRLEQIQPESGGYLEAIPLTAFVTMSLACSGQGDGPVVARGLDFLRRTARSDGSWAIDADLAVWLTTLSVLALGDGRTLGDPAPLCEWLLARQGQREHPYTHAAAGGWAWTDQPGGVYDADDTAGALLALRALGRAAGQAGGEPWRASMSAIEAGLGWLADLQNRDGGIPTFCRGWGKLPFDRSGADLTAHAVRAWSIWMDDVSPALAARLERAVAAALGYLAGAQQADGAWQPLWFGNQRASGEGNPAYGTARVVLALAQPEVASRPGVAEMLSDGGGWLLAAQNVDGGWGGAAGLPSSIEETAVALEALAVAHARKNSGLSASPTGLSVPPEALERGASWLIVHTASGQSFPSSPIGLYFARLWYSERLYPVIFTASALRAVKAALARPEGPARVAPGTRSFADADTDLNDQ